MNMIAKSHKYLPMELEERRKVLPEKNVAGIYPAEKIRDAFITANGRHRIDIYGPPDEETVAYTHEWLYEPVWDKTPLPPDLTEILPEIRRLLLGGCFEEAEQVLDKEQRRQCGDDMLVLGDDGSILPHPSPKKHLAFRSVFRQEVGEAVNYLRYLDLNSGECVTRWDTKEGTWMRRRLVSFHRDIVVQEFTAPDKGLLHITLENTLPGKGTAVFGSPAQVELEHPDKCDLRMDITDHMAKMSCAYDPKYQSQGYVAVLRIINEGGSLRPTVNGFEIRDCSRLVLLTRIKKYPDSFEPDRAAEEAAEYLENSNTDYGFYLKKNTEILSDKMNRSGFFAGDVEQRYWSVEELLSAQHSCEDFNGMLLSKLFDMSRFFLITDTGDIPPDWGQHNINTNAQVCSGNLTGLFEEMEVYFRYYEERFSDFRTNAKRLFGARGLLASVHCDYNSGLFYHFSKTYPHFAWTGCLGWIYNELWGYYLVTGDQNFLRNRIIPALKEMALFYEDYACDVDENGKSIFYPSYSPENPSPANTRGAEGCYPMSINAVMDIAICREILTNLIDGCMELGTDMDMIPHWKAQIDKLPDYLLDEEGGLKEWAWPSVKENYNHRHVSHHYDAWPGHLATWEDTPELAMALTISNRKRGQQTDNAHGILHRTFTSIRLKDKENTASTFKQLMEQGYITRTLNTSSRPYAEFSTDFLGAAAAMLAEMAVYSNIGIVEVLPAMVAAPMRGEVKGIWLYTFAKLEQMSWDLEKKSISGVITSYREQKLVLRYREGGAEFIVDGEKKASNGCDCEIFPKKDKSFEFVIDLS